MSRLLCFGLGYSARFLALRLQQNGWEVLGTTRSEKSAEQLKADGFNVRLYSGEQRVDELAAELGRASHVLHSIAPGEDSDPVLKHFSEDFERAKGLQWLGYLSTVGVYGDHAGAWVNEETPVKPISKRSVWRAHTERKWLDFGKHAGVPVHIFRLAGIYGPGTGPQEKVRSGTARRINKPGQVFNRIHVEDIASVLEASIAQPNPGAIYNVCDDEPAPPQDVVAYVCDLLGKEPPAEVSFEDADLTPMGRSFYGENKRVSNRRIRVELGVKLKFPTYREGMKALAEGFD